MTNQSGISSPKNRIKELRLERHKTQKEVGKAVGMTDRAIAHYENGIREPKLETWIKLAFYFNVPVSYLQGLTNNRNTEGYHIAPINLNVSQLIKFDYLFPQKAYKLADGEKLDLVGTVDQVTGIIEKYIPLTSDDKKTVSEKKQILAIIHSLINSLYFLLVISEQDEQKQIAIDKTKKFAKSLAKIWDGPTMFN